MFKYLIASIILLILIILLSLLSYFEIISFDTIATLITLFTFIFGIYTYKKDNQYKKNKDTYDYVDNLIDFLQNSFYGHLKSTIKIYQSTYQIKS